MDIDELKKKFGRENEVNKSAAEAIAKTLGAPAFQTVVEQHRRMTSEAVQSLIRGAEFSSFQNATQAMIGEAKKQVAMLCNASAVGSVDKHIRSLISGVNADAFRELNSVSLQAEEARKLTESLLTSVRLPEVAFPTSVPSRFEYESVHRPMPPFIPQPRRSPAEQFMRRLGEHLERAEAEATDAGGQRVVRCKGPAGEEIRVLEISLEDEHFVRVKGVDQSNQVREFTGHYSAIGITIEVVTFDDVDGEDENDPIN